MGDWDENNLRQLIGIIRCFYLVSGLRLNLKKSSLIGVGVTDQLATEMAFLTGCSVATLPCKYFRGACGRLYVEEKRLARYY